MNKKILIANLFATLMLLVPMTSVTGTLIIDTTTSSNISGNTLYVGGDGPGNYSKIQDAIDNASDEDRVFVYAYSSPYNENLIVDVSINLVGENRDTTFIDGKGIEDVVYISANGVTVSGFTIQNSGDDFYDAGIDIHSNSNTITGNTISNNMDDGINLKGDSNTITGNTITSNNGDGIFLDDSSSNTITGNTITSNNRGGIPLWDSSNNTTITSNTISNNRGGIFLDDSSSNTITSNTITSNNWDGIHLRHSSNNNTITGNTITSNNGDGIFLGYSSGNTITGNAINSNNDDGIRLFGSGHNTILKNNFIDNEQDASFRNSPENIWKRNTWKQNYWNRPRILPKLIFGEIEIKEDFFYIPWINIDWRPAKEPYDI